MIRCIDIQCQYIELVHIGLLHDCTFALEANTNDAQNVRVDTTRGKR